MVDIKKHNKFAELLQKNLPFLVENTKCNDKFLNYFLSDKSLDPTAVDVILGKTSDVDRSTAFYLKEMSKRGPKVLPVLINALRATAQDICAEHLEKEGAEFLKDGENSKLDLNSHNTGSIPQLVAAQGSLSHISLSPSATASNAPIRLLQPAPVTRDAQPINYDTNRLRFTRYQIKSNPRGYALIINMINFTNSPDHHRFGAELDSRELIRLLQDFDYTVYPAENLTAKDLNETITAFIELFRKNPVDSCIVSIMSHGDNEEQILTADCKLISVRSILERFNNVNCPELKNKPKIFFLQHCRGDTVDEGVAADTIRPRPPQDTLTLPTWTDMLICYSTLEGHYSFRDTRNGTWFIQLLCEVFRRHAKEMDICKMLNLVALEMCSKVANNGEKQICPFTNVGFFHEFYFHPRE